MTVALVGGVWAVVFGLLALLWVLVSGSRRQGQARHLHRVGLLAAAACLGTAGATLGDPGPAVLQGGNGETTTTRGTAGATHHRDDAGTVRPYAGDIWSEPTDIPRAQPDVQGPRPHGPNNEQPRLYGSIRLFPRSMEIEPAPDNPCVEPGEWEENSSVLSRIRMVDAFGHEPPQQLVARSFFYRTAPERVDWRICARPPRYDDDFRMLRVGAGYAIFDADADADGALLEEHEVHMMSGLMEAQYKSESFAREDLVVRLQFSLCMEDDERTLPLLHSGCSYFVDSMWDRVDTLRSHWGPQSIHLDGQKHRRPVRGTVEQLQKRTFRRDR